MSDPAPITPWPLPRDARRVLLIGGTFDPPHRGHVEFARARRETGDEWMLFVPAAQSPLKEGRGQTPSEHRVAMLRLAVAEVEGCAVWTDEVDRSLAAPGVPSYTIDTLRRIESIAPGLELRMLIGSDQAAQFHRWRESREIMDRTRLAIMPRAPYETWEKLEAALRAANFWTDREILSWESIARHAGMTEASPALDPANSTEIRRIIGSRGVREVPAGWLHPAVAAYIEQHGLYRAG